MFHGNLLSTLLVILLVLFAAAFGFTQWKVAQIEKKFPNQGTLTDIGGYELNSLEIAAGENANLPTLVFIHGASGNLLDQANAFRKPLEGRARLLFVDRPGFGYSDRGPAENDTPAGQADAISKLLQLKGIEKAIIIGHSFGGAIVASLALRHPDQVQGLVFIAAATHPWEGGVDWYYDLAATPVIGWLFCNTVALPAGLALIDNATKAVFSPNKAPDNYVEETAAERVLRPETFCNNARDVAGLNAYVKTVAPLYKTIKAPAIIISGDEDDIVAEEIHSVGLNRDIPNSELVWLHGVGHKPDYVATDIVVAAIEKLAGRPRDLQAMARDLKPQ
ncbi:alpha/beta fold hydrolase [Rhizobium sp. L1K21]|uniref:alpha/beta fold hydrolase n=1 Tax=Rhizobium sp. L1K21 TaxID=2954933 RepID=UPI002092CAA4|nr:alpha/beta hydrolase [Rhizobium sp. L1K21]MCO6185051.1 alpha/beta hydrolase [Rhizobium sp. L1K21]